jgi:death-on-curing protein
MAPRIGYYQSLAELAAAYAFGVAKNHAFIDANKRTALLSAAVFLGVNGYPLQLDTAEWLSLIEGIADGSVSREALIDGFTRAMGGDPVELDE